MENKQLRSGGKIAKRPVSIRRGSDDDLEQVDSGESDKKWLDFTYSISKERFV